MPVSAEKGTQLRALLDEIRKHLPVAPAIYDEDEITDRSERFLAAELVRERIFRLLGDELPYSIAVDIESFEIEGNLRRIAATIYVDRPSHKAHRDRREGRDAQAHRHRGAPRDGGAVRLARCSSSSGCA